MSIYVTRNFRAVVFDRAFSLFESKDVSATARPAPHVGRKDFVGHAGEALAGVVASQFRERRAGVVLAERLTGQANQGAAGAAPLGSWTVRVICSRLLQPTGRFRRRSLSLVAPRCFEFMSMGSLGDHPISDLVYWGRNVFPKDIADMLRLLHARDPKMRDIFALDAYDWAEGRALDEGRAKLRAALQKYQSQMSLTEPILRDQLRETVTGDIVGFELHPMPNRTGDDGRRYFARDGLIHTYDVRARSADQDGKPERAAVWRGFLKNLREVLDDEEICFWTAILANRRVRGCSTSRRLIGIWPDWFYMIYTDD